MSRPWRLLFTGRQSGAFNMAADAAVLHAVEAGGSPPTLRLYGWDPPCVSLGHFQNAPAELDSAALCRRGWDWVKRPTGGRAVLHVDEITYSLALRQDAAPWGATLRSSHARIGQAWAQALAAYAVRVADGDIDAARAPAGPGGARPCFASTARDELSHAGRKVVGSAQRRTRGALLQHGSIPLTQAHEDLVDVLRICDEDRDRYRKEIRSHAVSLREIGPVPPAPEAWMRELAASFCTALGVAAAPGDFSDAESDRLRQGVAEHQARQREFFALEPAVMRA